MTNPQMVLLDEPVEGLGPLLVKTLAEKITGGEAQGDDDLAFGAEC